MTTVVRTVLVATLLLIAAVAGAQPDHPAVYRVTFDATWSMATHPDMFPPNPHFSWLIGGTHDDQVAFWTEGQTATLGIRRMAEWGSPSPLDQEVLDAAAAGHAGEVIQSDMYPMSPGQVSTEFTVTPATPLATVVTMLAPSPDWFVGTNGLDLRDGNGWATSITVDLYPYDAGTDSGVTYTSVDQPTTPQEPIAAIAGAPFEPGVPVGTMTFTLLTSATDVPPTPALDVAVAPNPFNPRTEVAFTAPVAGRAVVTLHDTRGRLVATLLDGIVAAGPQSAAWNGLNDDGRPASSGTYVARVRIGRWSESALMTLAR